MDHGSSFSFLSFFLSFFLSSFLPSFLCCGSEGLRRSADMSEEIVGDCVWRRCVGFEDFQVIPLHWFLAFGILLHGTWARAHRSLGWHQAMIID
jgi:hypothetical protein